jgi:uncharacterized protein
MVPTVRQQIEELPRSECEALLARNHLGRMALSFRDRVDIRPMTYVFDQGWIFGRTGAGEKLRTLQHNRWVAFQVDEVRDLWNWDSVVIRGAVHLLDEPRGTDDRELREQALRALRGLEDGTLGEGDPAPDRDVLFGLAPQEFGGRRSLLVPTADPGG